MDHEGKTPVTSVWKTDAQDGRRLFERRYGEGSVLEPEAGQGHLSVDDHSKQLHLPELAVKVIRTDSNKSADLLGGEDPRFFTRRIFGGIAT